MPRFSYSLVTATLEDSTIMPIGLVIGQLDSNMWNVFPSPVLTIGEELSDIEADFFENFLELMKRQIALKTIQYDLEGEYPAKDFLESIDKENAEKYPNIIVAPLASIIAPTIELAFKSIFKRVSHTTEHNLDATSQIQKDSFYNQEEDPYTGDLETEEAPRDTNIRLVPDSSKKNDYPILTEPTPLQELRKELVATLFQFGDLFDKVLEVIATPILNRLYDKNEKAYMANPTYAKIENKRKNNDGTFILYSEKDNLGWNENEIQRDIRQSVRRHPWWEPILVLMTNSPIDNSLRRVQRLFQRINRGWDDRDVWNLDTSMTKSLGAQLIHLAKTSHGWPGTPEFPHADDWTDALHLHGEALLNYSKNKYDYEGQDYEELHEAAQEALYWVADHIGHLWD